MKDLGIEGMKVGDLKPLVERAYREMAPLQWVREVVKNASEAGATTVRFTVEMQAVEQRSVYRRVIADDGEGMDPDELVSYMAKFGGGGKPIGGVHENFGIGAKSGLLPWNRYGVVVISYRKGNLALIWLCLDEKRQAYGLRRFEAPIGNGDTVITTVLEHDGSSPMLLPGEPGIDWSQVAPKWAREHGTTIVLLGNSATDDTVLGDPRNPSERETKAVTKYLNARFWKMPDSVSAIRVDELRSTSKDGWPRSAREAHAVGSRRFNSWQIKGARSCGGKLASSGFVDVPGAQIEWFLWDGPRPDGQHQIAEDHGYIAVEYRDELYGLSRNPMRTRAFGLGLPAVQRRTWLVIHPDEYSEKTQRGVYPRGDRSELLMAGGTEAGQALPYSEWGEAFVAAMPEALADAIRSSFEFDPATIEDAKWKDRLKDRFGKRWRMLVKKLIGFPRGVEPLTETSKGGSGDEPKGKPRIAEGGAVGGGSDAGLNAGVSDAHWRPSAGVEATRSGQAGWRRTA